MHWSQHNLRSNPIGLKTPMKAKERIVEALRDENKPWAERTARVRSILDEFKGSYAARYLLEALMIMGGDVLTGCKIRGACQLVDAIDLLTPPENDKAVIT